MKTSYSFTNLIGTVYTKGNLTFTPDGDVLISPVGNRINCYDLKKNVSETLPLQSYYSIEVTALSPTGQILIASNEKGETYMVNLLSKAVIHRQKFDKPISNISFSPNGLLFSICKGESVYIYKVPGSLTKEYSPFALQRVLTGAHSDVTYVSWTLDSSFISVGCKDTNTRLYPMKKFLNVPHVYSVGGHQQAIVACYFIKDSLTLITICRSGVMCIWECSALLSNLKTSTGKVIKEDTGDTSEDDMVQNEDIKIEKLEKSETTKMYYTKKFKHQLIDCNKEEYQKVYLTSSSYCSNIDTVITGYSNGNFLLHDVPCANLMHSLSMCDSPISSICVDKKGEWVALGSKERGQLVVWEWQSETFVMKQQSHANTIKHVAYSPDGLTLVTGGDDSKVKMWNVKDGSCFVTFTEHTSSITGVIFTRSGKAVISSSLDGTVRAFDTLRYRNFRTLTSPRPAQFSCLAVDPSSELVAVGAQDTFEIFLWSLQTGRLLEILSGHEGPVSSLAFNPAATQTLLVSTSWDKTIKFWEVLTTSSARESVSLKADGLSVCFHPDGQEVAVSSLDGLITILDSESAKQISSIEGKYDLGCGRLETDLVTPKTSIKCQSFTSLCYSPDGQIILAAGHSKNLCMYHAKEGLLVKKFVITENRSLDGVDDYINKRKMTEWGNLSLVEERDDGNKVDISLPGVKSGDMAARNSKPPIEVSSLQFSPGGDSWVASTTEGVLMYSLYNRIIFDPYLLDPDVTPINIKKALNSKQYGSALMLSLRLNEKVYVQQVLESVPMKNVELLVETIPGVYVEKLLRYLATFLESTPHLEFYLIWTKFILTKHCGQLKSNSDAIRPDLRLLQKSLLQKQDCLSKLCNYNKYRLAYISKVSALQQKRNAQQMQSDNTDLMDVAIES